MFSVGFIAIVGIGILAAVVAIVLVMSNRK